jgi:hypothetical protein
MRITLFHHIRTLGALPQPHDPLGALRLDIGNETDIATVVPTSAAPAAQPTRIAKLWTEYKKLRKKYSALHRRFEAVDQEVERRAGEVDPAIMYGEESNALGITDVGAPADSYIWPLYIEGALTRIEFAAKIGVEKVDKERPLYGEWRLVEGKEFKLTETQLARQQRFSEILEISRERTERIGRLRRELGWNELNDEMDAIAARQGDVECRILNTPGATPPRSHNQVLCK